MDRVSLSLPQDVATALDTLRANQHAATGKIPTRVAMIRQLIQEATQ